MNVQDLDLPCPALCGKNVADHTMREYYDCLIARSVDAQVMPESQVVASITVTPGSCQDPAGGAKRYPMIRFTFNAPGGGLIGPFDLVLEPTAMRSVRALVSSNVDAALLHARRGR